MLQFLQVFALLHDQDLQRKLAFSFHVLASVEDGVLSLSREDLRRLLVTTLKDAHLPIQEEVMKRILDNTMRLGDSRGRGRLSFADYQRMLATDDNRVFLAKWFTIQSNTDY